MTGILSSKERDN